MKLEKTNHSVQAYLGTLNESQQSELIVLINLMEKVSQKPAQMWGDIIGFGHLHYRYPTGHQGEMPLLGLARRKQSITLYLSYDVAALLNGVVLGKYRHGKGCLYIAKLSDINLEVLEKVLHQSVRTTLAYDFIKVIE